MRRKSVVFPAPLGPTRPLRSSRFTCSDTSANNVRPANLLVSPLIVSIRNAGCCVEDVDGASAQLEPGASGAHLDTTTTRPEVVFSLPQVCDCRAHPGTL